MRRLIVLLAMVVQGLAVMAAQPCAEKRIQYPDYQRRWPQLKGVMLGATGEKEFKDLRDMGATLVRYQMHAQWSSFTNAPDPFVAFEKWCDGKLDHLEKMLAWGRRYGIKICVDQHTHIGGFTDEKYSSDMVCADRRYTDALIRFWQKTAKRFKGNWDVIYAYDILNEPIDRENAKAPFRWFDVQCEAIEAIRAIDPEAVIAIEQNCNDSPRGYDIKNPYGLSGVKIYPYDNLIYQVHVYQPMDFTHQGLFQKKDKYKPVVYPNKEKGWDKEFIRKEIQSIRDFQLRTGARIYVGEFSAAVYAPGSDQYVNDLCELFQEYGWDWTYHAFRESECWSFEHEGPSFYELKPSTAKPRQAILRKFFADGLHAPGHHEEVERVPASAVSH